MVRAADPTSNSKLVIAGFLDAMAKGADRIAVIDRYIAAPELKEKLLRFEADYPGFRIVPTDVLAEGELAVVQFYTALPEGEASAAVTSTAGLHDRRAKPRQASMEGIALCCVQGERITEVWVHSDVMTQVIEVINGGDGVDAAKARVEARLEAERRAGAADPEANKLLIEGYLLAMNGRAKTAELIESFANDPTLVQSVLAFEESFPNFSMIPEAVVAERDKVAVRFHTRQTHAAEFMGVPLTGASVSIPGLIVYRIEGGKIVEHWLHADMWSLMEQLGALGSVAVSA